VFAANFNHFTQEVRRVDPDTEYRLCVEDGVPFCWVKVPPYRGNSVGRVWNMACFARQLTAAVRSATFEKPDVIIGSSVHPFAAWAAERCAKRFAVPFVFEVRDLWPQTLLDLGSFKRWHPFILLLSWLEVYLYRKASQIITLLPGAGDYISTKGGAREKISWIPNGVDFSMVPRLSPPSDEQPFVIAYAGAMGLANGLDTILEVARDLKRDGWEKRVVFRIYGNGPHRERLIEESSRSGLANVEFRDSVPKVQIYSELMQAHAFFLYISDSPLYRWGYSMNKLFDYFACARPILLAANASYNPVAEAKAGLTVRPDDHAGLLRCVKQLAEMPPAVRSQMGMSGRLYAEQHHDFEALAARLEAVLVRSRTVPTVNSGVLGHRLPP